MPAGTMLYRHPGVRCARNSRVPRVAKARSVQMPSQRLGFHGPRPPHEQPGLDPGHDEVENQREDRQHENSRDHGVDVEPPSACRIR
jgi:hypothetical protein